MITRILKSGDRIELKRYGVFDSDIAMGTHFSSELIEIIDEHLIVTTQIHDGDNVLFPETGEHFELRFVAADGSFMCKSEVANTYKRDSKYIVELRLLSDLQRDRRRKYFRIDVVRPLQYRCYGNIERQSADYDDDHWEYYDDAEYSDPGEIPYLSGMLSNISGGGAKFSSETPLLRDDLIEMTLLLEDLDTEPLQLKGHVIYTESLNNRSMKYEHRLEFIDIDADSREKIVKYAFEQERKQKNL